MKTKTLLFSILLALGAGSASAQVDWERPVIEDCLAASTEITLANGEAVPIEQIDRDDAVLAGDGRERDVSQQLAGRKVKAHDMIALRDDDGHKLILTGAHPVMTPDRGPVRADELEVGDIVFSENGQSRLIEVEEGLVRTRVYNLALDNAEGLRNEMGSTMYANGILVGDGLMELGLGFSPLRSAGNGPHVPQSESIICTCDDPGYNNTYCNYMCDLYGRP